MTPTQRRQQILDWLHEHATLTIDDLVQRLDVSVMTVHRDLDALAKAGELEKVHGGAQRLARKLSGTSSDDCRLCGMMLPARTTFTLQTQTGEQLQACCPHCGLLLLHGRQDVVLALARDFIYGRAINVYQAFFVIESSITLCCQPSLLCFACEDDALRFQTGFGGDVLAYADAQRFVLHRHAPD